jgi:hypothetical protein|tara:strand:- start:998 stop:1279 length:282 start_codon:yes stop_codon:yes gene_type:complete
MQFSVTEHPEYKHAGPAAHGGKHEPIYQAAKSVVGNAALEVSGANAYQMSLARHGIKNRMWRDGDSRTVSIRLSNTGTYLIKLEGDAKAGRDN